MDNIGDFLYVIIGLIWLLISGYRNFQKQKKNRPGQQNPRPARRPEPTPQPESRRPTFTIEDFLDPVPPPEPKPVRKTVVEVAEMRRESRNVDFTPQKEYNFDKLTSKKRKKRKLPGLDEPFNLRKAVIYEIIMKRPDFH